MASLKSCLNSKYTNFLRIVLFSLRLAGHVARMGEERGVIGSCWGSRREGHYWGDLGVDGWIILG